MRLFYRPAITAVVVAILAPGGPITLTPSSAVARSGPLHLFGPFHQQSPPVPALECQRRGRACSGPRHGLRRSDFTGEENSKAKKPGE
jgi:hypothetical protein